MWHYSSRDIQHLKKLKLMNKGSVANIIPLFKQQTGTLSSKGCYKQYPIHVQMQNILKTHKTIIFKTDIMFQHSIVEKSQLSHTQAYSKKVVCIQQLSNIICCSGTVVACWQFRPFGQSTHCFTFVVYQYVRQLTYVLLVGKVVKRYTERILIDEIR